MGAAFFLAALAAGWTALFSVGEQSPPVFVGFLVAATLAWIVGASALVLRHLLLRDAAALTRAQPHEGPLAGETGLETALNELFARHFEELRRMWREAVAREAPSGSEGSHLWIERLHHVFRLLAEAESEVEVCENLVAAFSLLDEYTQIALFRGENELGPLVLMAALGIPDAAMKEWRGKPWRPPLWGVVAPVMAKRKPYALSLSEVEANEFPWPVRGDFVEVLPLLGVQRLQGVVVLFRMAAPQQMEPVRQQVYDILSWMGGHALENLSLAREIQEHATELAAVHSLTRALMFAASVEEMLRILQDEVTQIAGPATVALVLPEDLERGRVRTAYPEESREHEHVAAAMDWRVLRWVWQAVQPVFYTPGHVGENVGDLMFETGGQVLVLPVEGQQEPVALLVVCSRSPTHIFEELHLMALRALMPAVTVGLYALRVPFPGRGEPGVEA